MLCNMYPQFLICALLSKIQIVKISLPHNCDSTLNKDLIETPPPPRSQWVSLVGIWSAKDVR